MVERRRSRVGEGRDEWCRVEGRGELNGGCLKEKWRREVEERSGGGGSKLEMEEIKWGRIFR
jgi:hypothetical protein